MKAISSAILVLAGAVGLVAAISGWSVTHDKDLIRFAFIASCVVALIGLIGWFVEMKRES